MKRTVFVGILVIVGWLAAPLAAQLPGPPAVFAGNLYGDESECSGEVPFPLYCRVDITGPGRLLVGEFLTLGGERPSSETGMVASSLIASSEPQEFESWIRLYGTVRRAGVPPGTQVTVELLGVGDLELFSSSPNVAVVGTASLLGEELDREAVDETEKASFAMGTAIVVAVDEVFEIQFGTSVRAEALVSGIYSYAGSMRMELELTISIGTPDADAYEIELSENLAALLVDGFEDGTADRWNDFIPETPEVALQRLRGLGAGGGGTSAIMRYSSQRWSGSAPQ